MPPRTGQKKRFGTGLEGEGRGIPRALLETEPSYRATVCQALASSQLSFYMIRDQRSAISGHAHHEALVVSRVCWGQGLLLQEDFQRHLQAWISMLVCPSLAMDPGLVRKPSEPRSGLRWVWACTRNSILPCSLRVPLWLEWSFKSLPYLPTLPGSSASLPSCCGPASQDHHLWRVGELSVHKSPPLTTSSSISRCFADEETEAVRGNGTCPGHTAILGHLPIHPGIWEAGFSRDSTSKWWNFRSFLTPERRAGKPWGRDGCEHGPSPGVDSLRVAWGQCAAKKSDHGPVSPSKGNRSISPTP